MRQYQLCPANKLQPLWQREGGGLGSEEEAGAGDREGSGGEEQRTVQRG